MKLLIVLAAFLVIMLFLVLLAIVLERYWRNYQAEQAAKTAEHNARGLSGLAESVARWTTQLRAMIQPTPPTDNRRATQFREWVRNDLSKEKDVQSWLLALPEPGIALLTKHIAAFCQEMNFDLNWLIAPQGTVAPELKTTMQGVIVDYCRACQKAIPAQKAAKLFTTYQQLLQNATGKEEQALGRTLYANLVTQGLAPTPAPAELLNATEKERQQQAFAVIQQVAAKDWAQFATVLQATMTPNGDAVIPSAVIPSNGHNGHNGHNEHNGTPLQNAAKQKAG